MQSRRCPRMPLLLLAVIAACGPAPRAATPKPPAAEPQRPSGNGAVLQGQAALATLRQCSRSTPNDVLQTWTPGAGEIAALEAKLGRVLTAARRRMPGPRRWHLEDYARQYAGIVHRDGTRGIYVNGFLHEHVRIVARHGADTLAWREHPVFVCDGGEAFFGVEYHPGTGTFGPVQFNGGAP